MVVSLQMVHYVWLCHDRWCTTKRLALAVVRLPALSLSTKCSVRVTTPLGQCSNTVHTGTISLCLSLCLCLCLCVYLSVCLSLTRTRAVCTFRTGCHVTSVLFYLTCETYNLLISTKYDYDQCTVLFDLSALTLDKLPIRTK